MDGSIKSLRFSESELIGAIMGLTYMMLRRELLKEQHNVA